MKYEELVRRLEVELKISKDVPLSHLRGKMPRETGMTGFHDRFVGGIKCRRKDLEKMRITLMKDVTYFIHKNYSEKDLIYWNDLKKSFENKIERALVEEEGIGPFLNRENYCIEQLHLSEQYKEVINFLKRIKKGPSADSCIQHKDLMICVDKEKIWSVKNPDKTAIVRFKYKITDKMDPKKGALLLKLVNNIGTFIYYEPQVLSNVKKSIEKTAITGKEWGDWIEKNKTGDKIRLKK